MLAPQIPLRLIAQYTPVTFSDANATLDVRKAAVEAALSNCRITRDIGTDQMNVSNGDLLDDIHNMRAEALAAIPIGEAAVRAGTLNDFNHLEGEFRTQYDNLKSSVKSFLWDAGPQSKRHLWPLVGDLM